MRKMDFINSSNVFYQYTADRLKRRREVLKLTNDVIARKKIFVHYEAYKDWATDEDEPEKFISEDNIEKTKFDSTLISRIINNERGKIGRRSSPNPFLIPPSYEELLVKQLQFNSKRELFWGASVETEYIAKTFYTNLFEEVLADNQSELSEILNLCLIDYVPYSRDLAYYQMIVERCIEQYSESSDQSDLMGIKKKNSEIWNTFINLLDNDLEHLINSLQKGDYLAIIMYATINFIMDLVGKNEDRNDIHSVFISFQILRTNIEYFRREAIGRIIYTNFDSLLELFQDYFYQLDNFKSLNKKISKFTLNILTPFFKELLGDSDEFKNYSLGYRVKNIIETDIESIFSYASKVSQEQFDDTTNPNSNMYKKWLQTTKVYISDLKHIQWLTDGARSVDSAQKDLERCYIACSDIENLHSDWLKKYNSYLSNIDLIEYGYYMEADEYFELLDK